MKRKSQPAHHFDCHQMVFSAPFGAHLFELQRNGELVLIGGNPAADLLVAVDHTSKIGSTFEQVFPDLIGSDLKSRYIGTAATGENFTLDGVFYSASQMSDALSISSAQVAENKVAVFIHDHSERKRSVKQLQESEARYRNLIELSPDPIVIHTNGKFTYLNQAACELLKAPSPEAFLGRSVFEIVPPDSREMVKNRIEALGQRSKAPLLEEKFIALDGTMLEVEVTANPIVFQGEQSVLVVARDISARKRAQESLRDADRMYRTMIENAGVAIGLFDPEGKLLLINTLGAAYFDSTPQELIGRSLFDINDAEFVHDMFGIIQSVFRTGELDTSEDFISIPSGEYWFYSTFQPIHNEAGEITSVQVVSQDITERKKMEEALLLSESRLQAAVENLPFDFWACDADGKYILQNSVSIQNWGNNLGKRPQDLITAPAVLERWISNNRRAMEGEVVQNEIEYTHDGHRRSYHEIIAPIYQDKNVQGILGVNIDITERKRAEEQIRILAHTVKSISECVSITDKENSIIFVNDAFMKTYGYHAEEILGKHISVLHASSNDPHVLASIHPKTLEGGWQGELLNVRKDGMEFPVALSTSIVRDERGMMVAFVGIASDITERKRAQEALQASEQKLRNIIEHSTNLFYSHTAEHVLTYVSPQSREFFDCEPEEALVRWTEIVTNNPINEIGFELTQRAIDTGITQPSYELELVGKKGRVIWVEVHERPVVQDGKTIAIVGALTDITDRKKALDELQASERRQRTLLDAIPDMMFRLNSDGVFLDYKADDESRLLLPPENFLGKKIKDIFPDDVQERSMDALREARTTGSVVQFEYRLEMNGTSHDYEARMIAGEQDDVITIIRDISERTLAEKRIRLQAQLLDAATDSILLIDADGRIIYANEAAYRTRGFTEEEILSANIRDVNPMDTRPMVDLRIQQALNEGEILLETKHLRKDGSTFPVEVYARSIELDHRPYILSVNRDITDRKRIEHELITAKEKAERSDRLKDAFIANMSHEIRTPLNIIMGYSSIVADVVKDRMTQDELGYLDSIHRSGDRLMRTVDLILNLSRIETGDIKIVAAPVDLHDLVKKITGDFQRKAQDRSLALSFHDEATHAVMQLDEYCVSQALTNLIDNALKYTKEGFVRVRLYANEEKQVCIDVRDSGIGISAEYLPHVFDPYSQEYTGIGREFEGIGLGLALTKKYIELHPGSTITVASEKGVGTTFTIRLSPDLIRQEKIEKKKSDSPTPTINTGNQSDASGAIMIVEDDTMTIELMKTMLHEHYHLHVAPTLDTAWKILEEKPVALILMDVALPGGQSGLDFTRELRTTTRFEKIPIIAVTARTLPEDKVECLQAGCNAYLPKPIVKERLMNMIQKFVVTM